MNEWISLLLTTTGCFFHRLDQCNTDSGRLSGVLWTLCPQPECGDADEVWTPVSLHTHSVHTLPCPCCVWSCFLFCFNCCDHHVSCRQPCPHLGGFRVTLHIGPWLILHCSFRWVLIWDLLASDSTTLFMNSPHSHTELPCELHSLLQ